MLSTKGTNGAAKEKLCMEISFLSLNTNTLQNLYALFKSFLRGFSIHCVLLSCGGNMTDEQ